LLIFQLWQVLFCQVKVKLSVCLIMRRATKAYSELIAVRILNPGDRGGKAFASRRGDFAHGERAADARRIWAGMTAEPIWTLCRREKYLGPA
jgi:hypothetical protein